MTKLKFFLLPAIILLGGTLLNPQQAAAQTQEEFEAELTQYAAGHTYAEVIDYAQDRVGSMTVQAYFEDFAELQLLGLFIGNSQCLTLKRQICDNAFQAKLLEITAVSTVAMAACAIASE